MRKKYLPVDKEVRVGLELKKRTKFMDKGNKRGVYSGKNWEGGKKISINIIKPGATRWVF